MSSAKDKIVTALKVLLTALLLGTQTILNAGVFISVMLIPLLPYLFVLPKYLSMNSHVLNFEIWLIFFSNRFFIGQIILYIGLAVLIVAGIQWIWYHHKNERFFTRGLYSRIRHPQFTGIILITLGLTIVVLIQQSLDLTLIGTRHKLAYLEVPLYVGL